MQSSITAVPNLFGSRDQFHGRQFFHGWGWGAGGGRGDASGGNVSNGKRQMKLPCLPVAHLLLCGPVPNRPRTARGWEPLLQNILHSKKPY